jgi:hypothetical protein
MMDDMALIFAAGLEDIFSFYRNFGFRLMTLEDWVSFYMAFIQL